MSRTAPTVRFRHSSAITVAAVIAMIAGVSLATWAVYLLPLLIVPLAIAVWSWRVGTDAGPSGVTVRAALGSRRIPWSNIGCFVTDARGRVSAELISGKALDLPAVSAANLPRLVASSGQDLVTVPPVTVPPATVPPVTVPPATVPPVTVPPVKEPR